MQGKMGCYVTLARGKSILVASVAAVSRGSFSDGIVGGKISLPELSYNSTPDAYFFNIFFKSLFCCAFS